MSDLPHPLRATIGGFLFLCLVQPALGQDSTPPAPSSSPASQPEAKGSSPIPATTLNASPASASAAPGAAALSGTTAVPGASAVPLGEDQLLDTRTLVVDLANLTNLEALIPRLADRRVVFVGEAHDRYEDHLNQLAIIRGLHQRGADLAIGMEMFQQPFQAALDAYIADEIDEDEMLRRTDYFERWRFDYRLYRPILRFAREQGIPVIALNLEREITTKVGDGGLEALSAEERARIPAVIDRDDPAYRARVKAVFDLHPRRGKEPSEAKAPPEGKAQGGEQDRDHDQAQAQSQTQAQNQDQSKTQAQTQAKSQSQTQVQAQPQPQPQPQAHAQSQPQSQDDDQAFERFLSVQLLWDEGMAERATRYLQDHPGKQMVILAGSGHLEYGQGIPQRLQRRLPLSSAIVLNGGMRDLDPQAADFLLYPRRVELAATGRLGVMLDTEARGPGVAVQGFSDNSGAAVAGMKEGDRIVRVGGKGIEVYADIRVALMDSRPGQKLPVEVERGPAGAAERLTLEVELH